jgi:hypothetical protein
VYVQASRLKTYATSLTIGFETPRSPEGESEAMTEEKSPITKKADHGAIIWTKTWNWIFRHPCLAAGIVGATVQIVTKILQPAPWVPPYVHAQMQKIDYDALSRGPASTPETVGHAAQRLCNAAHGNGC